MTDLRAALTAAADDLVPEHEAFMSRVDGVRRLVRRRRAVRRVQTGAGAVVGIAAIGSAALWLGPGPSTDPVGAAAACGDLFLDALPPAGELDGFATIQMAQGQSVTMRTQLENLASDEVTTVGEVSLLVSLPGTGEVVGYASAAPDRQAAIAPGTAGDVFVTARLLGCGAEGVAPEPLADGEYDLTLTGTATAAGGTEVPWQAATTGITVENGQVRETGIDLEPVDAAFEPVCGDMIPAVVENPFWSSVAPAGSGPFAAGDPDEPYVDGLTLDLTIGTIANEPFSGELSAEVVTVLTDLDGRVITWWRASEHGRPLDLGPALDLAAEGTQLFDGFAWFPVLDTCGGDTAIPDGDYRLFTWTEVTARSQTSDAVEHYPMISAPLDVTVSGGSMTAS